MKLNCFILLLFLPFFGLCQTADSLLFEKASRLYDSDKFEPALKEVNSLIRKDHNQAKYFSLRGQIHYKLNKRTQAIDDFTKAIEVTRAHLPDPTDVEAQLFLRDIYDFFANNRPVLSSVQGLQESVHRSVVESTEERAALVRQRAGLFGVMAVLGLVLAIIAAMNGA